LISLPEHTTGLIEMNRNEEVEVKIFGALVSYIGTKELKVRIDRPLPLKTRSTVLVLVNGREISVLDGVDTEISPGDQVAFLPVSHGGSD
jgi:molybdopterin converting factor small subunit